MEELLLGFSVIALGMLIVFVVLITLTRRINRLSKPAESDARKRPEPAWHAADGISDEVLVVIAAAVAAVWKGENGLVIRHVKRIHNAPAWNRAGREEQAYSRF